MNKISNQLKQIFIELAPILAGFKIATIVMAYVGVGSLAKWVIERWYPFTRYVWDSFTAYWRLPEFTDLQKDALTALVFFLPLGISSLMSAMRKQREDVSIYTRIFSSMLGISFFLIICQDIVISAMYIEVENLKTSGYLENISIFPIIIILLISSAVSMSKFFEASLNIISDVSVDKLYKIINNINYANKIRIFILNIGKIYILYAFLLTFLFVYNLFKNNNTREGAIILGIIILVMLCIAACVKYSPRRLFSITGTALAFICAAFAYEGYLAAKNFIEKAPTESAQISEDINLSE